MANEWILQKAVDELAETTGVDAETVTRVLEGLGLRDLDKLDALRDPEQVITARDLHIMVRAGDFLVAL